MKRKRSPRTIKVMKDLYPYHKRRVSLLSLSENELANLKYDISHFGGINREYDRYGNLETISLSSEGRRFVLENERKKVFYQIKSWLKRNYKWLISFISGLLSVLLIFSCSSENEIRMLYTGSFVEYPGWLLQNDYWCYSYDELKSLSEAKGAGLTEGEDLRLLLKVSTLRTDSFVLSIIDDRGELHVIYNDSRKLTYIDAKSYIVTFENGYKEKAYVSKGKPYEESDCIKEEHLASGVVERGSLILSNKDTIYHVQNVGDEQVYLKMATPENKKICTLKLQK